MIRRALLLSGLVALAPGLSAQEPQNMQEALEQMQRRLAEMQNQGMDTTKIQGAFGEVRRQAETEGGVSVPGVNIRGKAGPGGATGRVNVGGAVDIRGRATGQGAQGSVNVGGIKIQGAAGQGGAGGSITIPGMGTFGGNVGPGGMSFGTGGGPQAAGAQGAAALQNMFQGANQGGMYSASLAGLRASVGMLKAYGQPTRDIEKELDSLEPGLKQMDKLHVQMMAYTDKGQVPPASLTKRFEAFSKALEPRLDSVAKKIEQRSDAMGKAMQKDLEGAAMNFEQMMRKLAPQGAGSK